MLVHHLRVLFILAVSSLFQLASGEQVQVEQHNYQFVAACPDSQYDLSFKLGLKEDGAKPNSLGVLFGFQDAANHYRLEGAKEGLVLSTLAGGRSVVLGEIRHWKPSARTEVLIRRRKYVLYVRVNGLEFPAIADAHFAKGRVALALDGGAPRSMHYQPIAEIAFDDNFMREETEQRLAPWEFVSGDWYFHSVKEKHPGTLATHSTNPFSLGSKLKDKENKPAIVTAGHGFWSDYEFQVSMKSHGGEGGLVFGYKTEKEHYRLAWQLTGTPRVPRLIRLLKVRNGEETLLAQGNAKGGLEQWYRLAVRLRGRRIQIYLDESLIFDVTVARAVRGRIGLLNLGPGEVVFDDVQVRDNEVWDFDEPSALKTMARTVSGHWRLHKHERKNLDGNTQHVSLSPGGLGRGVMRFGPPGWNGGVFSFDFFSRGEESIDLLAGGQKLFVIDCGRKKGELLTLSQWHSIRLDLTESHHALLYIDDMLHQRRPLTERVAGPFGLAVQGGLFRKPEVRNIRLATHRADDLEVPVRNQLFVIDPFMRHWSSPEGAWMPVDEKGTSYWHKGDFFGSFGVTLPPKNGAKLLFALDQPISGRPDAGRGYSAELTLDPHSKKATVTLKRLGKVVGSGSIAAPGPAASLAIRLHHDGKCLWARSGDTDLFNVRDPEPLPGTAMAIEGPEAFTAEDFRALKLQRNHIRDETFEHAFSNWIRTGTWEVTNRFSCTPTWSHLNGRSTSGAYLWNKFEYEGDLSLEFYVGERMRQSKEMQAGLLGSYPRVGDFDASFNCTGPDPSSGYTYLLGAWDPHWSEKWSRLLRAGQEVARTDKYLTPRTREGDIRAQLPWVSKGRPVHGAWYFIKIRRRGSRLEYYFDNKLVPELSFDDPNPLTGKRLAIWTQNNTMVIARAKISYTRRRVPPRLEPIVKEPATPAPEPALKITSSTNPGLFCDFEDGLCGWKTTEADQGADLSLSSQSPASRENSLKLTNASLGGDFGAIIPLSRLDAAKVVDFSFDYRIPPEVKVNFYLTLSGQKWFVHFTGVRYSDENLRRLADIDKVITDGKWHHATVSLAAAVLEKIRPTGEVPLTSLIIGNRHEGYLQAGLGGNPEGATFYLDNFRIATASPATGQSKFDWAPRPGLGVKSYSFSLDDREGTVLTDKPGTPMVSTSVGRLEPGMHVFHLRGLLANGSWTPTAQFPFFIQPVLSARLIAPNPARWGGEPLRFDIEPKAGAPLALPSLAFALGSRQFSNSELKPKYDPVHRTLDIDLSHAPLAFEDGQKVLFKLSFRSWAGEAPGSVQGQLTTRYEADHTGPTSSLLSYPKIQDFEGQSLGSWAPGSNCLIRIDRSTASSGNQSLKLFKPIVVGSFPARALANSFYGPAVDLGKTPVLTFDYRLSPELLIDIVARSGGDGWWRQIGFAGSGSRYPYIGSITEVKRVRQWRHAEIDLRRLFASRAYHPSMFKLTGLQFGDFGKIDMGKGYDYHIDNFGFIPAASAAKGIVLKWRATDPSGIRDYSFHWSAQREDAADRKPEGPAAERRFTKVPGGPQYFHLRARDRAGNWGPTAHYKFIIDNQAPVVALKSKGPTERWLAVSAKDEGSGVDVSALAMKVNGKRFSLQPAFTTFDQKAGQLRWDWPAATGLCSGKIANGFAWQFQAPAIVDHTGNAANSFDWNWKVDYSKDKVSPPAPAIHGPAESVFSFDSFTRKVGAWRNWGGQNGSTVTRVFDSDRKDYCLKIADDLTGGSGGVMINSKPFDAAKYPWIAFDYKIPANAKIHFLVHTSDVWRGITLTVPSTYPKFKNVGSVGVTADNTWRSVSFNLLHLLKKALPKAKNYAVRYLAIADYYTYYTPAGVPYFIDNFSIVGSCSAGARFTLSSYDSSGIARFRYRVSVGTAVSPEKMTNTDKASVPLPAMGPGIHYLHASAADGAGNWSPASRIAFWSPGAAKKK